MILLREYDEQKQLDRVWYDSSNVFYSECEDGDSAKKILRVMFKNGATYQYRDVDVNDYVMFIAGGLDNSNGKALNEFVKKKNCPYERTDSLNKEQLISEMEEIKARREKVTIDDCNNVNLSDDGDTNDNEKTTTL